MTPPRTPTARPRCSSGAASAEKLSGDDLDTRIAIFSRRFEAHGARGWTPEDVRPLARHRLYRATASEHYVLDEQDRQTPVSV